MPTLTIHSRMLTAAACAALLGAAGCSQTHVQASAPVYSAPSPSLSQPPMTTAPDTNATPPVEAAVTPPAPPSSPTTSQPLASIPAKETLPAPPKPVAEQPAAGTASEPPARAPAPQISPQLSAGDQASYQRKTTEDTAIAEKNLQASGGRQLNAEQQDLIGKIRSFLAQSQEASRGGDWTRAQNLSQKARLLSVELINSL